MSHAWIDKEGFAQERGGTKATDWHWSSKKHGDEGTHCHQEVNLALMTNGHAMGTRNLPGSTRGVAELSLFLQGFTEEKAPWMIGNLSAWLWMTREAGW